MSLDGGVVWERMDTCMCMTESLCCSPETSTILLVGYTPIQNILVLKKIKIKMAFGQISYRKAGLQNMRASLLEDI